MTYQQISATYSVTGSTYREWSFDTAEMSIQDIARRMEEEAEGVSLCHQCDHEVSDPEIAEMTSLVVDGVTYVRDGDEWVEPA